MPVIALVDISRRDVLVNQTTMFVVPATDKGIFNFIKASNVVGLRVKAAPSQEKEAYWTDYTYDINLQKINEDIKFIEQHLSINGVVVLYEIDIFSEITNLERYAPKTLDYLFKSVQNLKDRYSPKGFYNDKKEAPI
mgnify:FL=1|tara:strand:+ start:6214 stop:6624 length:411 start_codon:yes stop_codon:yes gene_type:complete